MSRILKRPMFRIGGSANDGIMSMAAPRKNYENGSPKEERVTRSAEEYARLLERFAGPGPSVSSDLGDLLISGGLNLMAGKGAGKGNLGAIAESYRDPYATFSKSRATEDMFKRQLRLSGATQAISSDDAMEIQKIKMADELQKVEIAKDKLFLETSGLGINGPNVLATKKKLQKEGIPVLEGIVASTGEAKVAKPIPSSVLAIPKGTVFFDIHGNFYKRVEGSPGYQRTNYSGTEIKVEPKTKKQTFIDTMAETVSPDDILMRQYLGPAADLLRKNKSEGGITTIDPRPWTKNSFYEKLYTLGKDKKTTME